MNNKNKAEGGYTLLFAVITAALVLGVAVFILSVSKKQFELSASARNSVYSFYAADAGVECAAAAMSNLNGGSVDASPSGTGATITCGVNSSGTAQTLNASFTGPSEPYPPALISSVQQAGPLYFGLGNGTCLRIVIFDGNGAASSHYTVIEARGYNRCTAANQPDTSNPTTVERALRISYRS